MAENIKKTDFVESKKIGCNNYLSIICEKQKPPQSYCRGKMTE